MRAGWLADEAGRNGWWSGWRAVQLVSLPRLPLSLLGIAVGLLLVTGFSHGLWTQRWQQSHELESAVARLDGVPTTLGSWKGEVVEPDREAFAQSGLAACVMRNYVERNRGSRVSVFLMCGRAGPTSVHTPEWCYGGAGYEMTAPPVRYALALEDGRESAEFWTAQFIKTGAVSAVPLRIFWSWNAAGTWVAPAHPRLSFGRYPALYKLYFVHDDLTPTGSLDQDQAVVFMRAFLPELSKVLFPAAGSRLDLLEKE